MMKRSDMNMKWYYVFLGQDTLCCTKYHDVASVVYRDTFERIHRSVDRQQLSMAYDGAITLTLPGKNGMTIVG